MQKGGLRLERGKGGQGGCLFGGYIQKGRQGGHMIYYKGAPIKLLLMQTESALLQNPSMLVKSLVGCLNQLVSETPAESDPSSVFNLKSAPTISISDYISRMVKYMNASLSVYIYSLVLLDKAQEYNPDFVVHKRNVHRLLLVSNLVAAKYIDDFYYKNSFYATVGGVSLKVLNQLQQEFLKLVGFNCHCEEGTFISYLERLDLFALVNETGDKENGPARGDVREKGQRKGRRQAEKKEKKKEEGLLETGSSKAEEHLREEDAGRGRK